MDDDEPNAWCFPINAEMKDATIGVYRCPNCQQLVENDISDHDCPAIEDE